MATTTAADTVTASSSSSSSSTPLTRSSTMPALGIPVIGLGTYTMSPEEAEAAVVAGLRMGYRHIDTAQAYKNEAGVGRGLAAAGVARADVFITTKLWPGNAAWGDPPPDYDGTLAACEASVAALGVDYVDLYLIHAPFAFQSSAAGLAQWRALVELKARGVCKAVGVSNFGVPHLEAIEAAGLPLPDANQLELHPLCQHTALLAWMAAKGVAPIAYSSLAPLATWRTKDDGTRFKSGTGDRTAATAAVGAVAAAHGGMTPAQVLLRWGLQRGFAILPKSVREDRMAQNLDVFGEARTLTAAEMEALDGLNAAGDTPLAWPHGDPSKSAIGK